jgi:hypothetical protein
MNEPQLFRVWGDTAFVDLMAFSRNEALLHGEELLKAPVKGAGQIMEWEDDED